MSALGSPVALLKALLMRLPLILKTAILHTVRMSPVSGKQDLRTELTVAIVRSFMNTMVPITKQQKGISRDPGIKGRLWVSKVKFPQPEIAVRDAVLQAIEALKQGDETYDIPAVLPVEAEWTGYRSGVDHNAPEPDISEEQKYEELKKEATADMVILYFHGGAYYLMDPCTHRAATSQLSKRTKAPVLSVRYRLAPQNPFPSALVDALVAYLSLISPPPGSFHAPVPAKKIVFAGDSAGGNLCLVLLQTLLTLQRISPTIHFHGRDIPIDTPAGVATSSPWCDITRSMPSIFANAKYDYLPLPSIQTTTSSSSWSPPPIPEDEAWPANPPRVDFFVNATTILHPLVSPLTASPSLWSNSPPVFISMGEETLSDEGLILARNLHRASVPVIVEQFEGMPHCFGLLMLGTPAARRFYDSMARFCRDVVVGGGEEGSSKSSFIKADGNATFIGFNRSSDRKIPLEEICPLSDEEVRERLHSAAAWRIEAEKELQKNWAAKKARL